MELGDLVSWVMLALVGGGLILFIAAETAAIVIGLIMLIGDLVAHSFDPPKRPVGVWTTRELPSIGQPRRRP